MSAAPLNPLPILLYDGGCATCSRIAQWVKRSAATEPGGPRIAERPVGNDPAELHRLNPALDIWDAYAASHVIMPDGSMKRGGEAVAEVLRSLPQTRWLTPCLDWQAFGLRPFQAALNAAYAVLDDVRPLLGCDSCGHPKPWVQPLQRAVHWIKGLREQAGAETPSSKPLHFRPRPNSAPS
jgi:predicted DCC family thiol-disulfide oxidoreductase YuxK